MTARAATSASPKMGPSATRCMYELSTDDIPTIFLERETQSEQDDMEGDEKSRNNSYGSLLKALEFLRE